MSYLVGQAVNIHIRSEGCNDPDKTPDTCGIAYIYVNDVDKSPHSRGHNVVVLDGATGNLTWLFANRKQISKELFYSIFLTIFNQRIFRVS